MTTTAASEPLQPSTANLLWALVVTFALCLVGTQCSCTNSHPPAHIALPSTMPVKRAVAVAVVHTDKAVASNARAAVLARKAVETGIAAGSQDALDLVAESQATADELIQVKVQLAAADQTIDTLTAQLLASQKQVDAQTDQLAGTAIALAKALTDVVWYRWRFWPLLILDVLAAVGTVALLVAWLLARFTGWGARTVGPVLAKAAPLLAFA